MKFSVITVNLNNAEGLKRTIASVASQTCHDFEYIVIDGGSTDGSLDVIKEYQQSVSYWVSEKDEGIYQAMNKGVAQAHGDYCLFMNSGDCLYNEHVLEHMERQLTGEGLIVGRVFSAKEGHPLFLPPERPLSLYFFYSATLPHQGTFILTDLLRKTPYREELKIVSDWAFFLEVTILQQCTVKFSDEKVALFDVQGLSTSHPQETWKEKEEVLRSLFPARVLKDYEWMKQSECLTQALTPQLKRHYAVDKLLYRIGSLLLTFKK